MFKHRLNDIIHAAELNLNSFRDFRDIIHDNSLQEKHEILKSDEYPVRQKEIDRENETDR